MRFEASVTHALVWLALLISPWFLLVTLLQGATPGVARTPPLPFALLWKRLFASAGFQGRKGVLSARRPLGGAVHRRRDQDRHRGQPDHLLGAARWGDAAADALRQRIERKLR